MSIPNKVNIPTAIFCDDVRREDNGKEFLIGVYSGSIIFPHFPGNIRLCIWLPWMGKSQLGTPTKFYLRLMENQNTMLESEFEIDTREESSCGSLAIGGIPAQFNAETTLRVEIKRGSEKWKAIREIDVRSGKTRNPDK